MENGIRLPGARRVSPVMIIVLVAAGAAALVLAWFAYRWWVGSGVRTARVLEYLRDPAAHADWVTRAKTHCPGAPFAFPTDGYVGYFWGDSFKPLQRHQGIDIFGNRPLGQTPVYSASDGFLTRLADWKSAVIVRVPEDPLMPGREIWLYYAHMADTQGNSFIDKEFPPGTMEKPVTMGQFLGFQGNYSGDPANPTGVHLHFSVVQDNGGGSWKNELDIANTLDPSPYLGMPLNAQTAKYGPTVCG